MQTRSRCILLFVSTTMLFWCTEHGDGFVLPPIPHQLFGPIEGQVANTQLNLHEDLLEEAARIRREAYEMDLALTRTKHRQLERKISRLRRKEQDVSELEEGLSKLQAKLAGEESPDATIASTPSDTNGSVDNEAAAVPPAEPGPTISTKQSKWKPQPFEPFDNEDLDVFLPVAKSLEVPLDASIDQQLDLFRSAPELRDFFQQKLTQLIMEPLKDIQMLQERKSDYLESTSATEKKQLKREIDALAKRIDYKELVPELDVICLDIPPMTDAELQRRIHHLKSYPPILQAIYKSKHSQQDNQDPTLSILLDYYEDQLQILEDVHRFSLTDCRDEVERAVASLPDDVRITYATAEMGLFESSVESVTDALVQSEDDNSPRGARFMSSISFETDASEDGFFSDVEFLDRSRFVQEMYPSVARLEPICPSLEKVAAAVAATSFRMTGPPERVIGGWYVRGEATDRALEEFEAQKDENNLQIYYILEPSPPTDEQVEMDEAEPESLLLITGRDNTGAGLASWTTKAGVSALSVLSTSIFGVLVAGSDHAPQVVAGLLAIQAAHELGHHAVAFRDKFSIGWPTLVPSTQLGSMGAITPLLSPPPNLKSIFDFSLAGPFTGSLLSLGMFVQGLSLDADSFSSGGLPSALLRSSALGGGLVESMLGSGSLLGESISLHPLAIAGYCGLLTNSVALLPLGNTDGGRISLAMFGRRGSYIVKTFTTALLCLAGIVGLDETGWLLTYALFATIWQRESEMPMRNEVLELDFARGATGIVAALLVALVLLPMQ